MIIEVGVRSEVLRSLIMNAWPPAVSPHHHKSYVRHLLPVTLCGLYRLTNCVMTAVGENLYGRHAARDRMREGSVVRVQRVDASKPGKDGAIGRVHLERASRNGRADHPNMRVQVHYQVRPVTPSVQKRNPNPLGLCYTA